MNMYYLLYLYEYVLSVIFVWICIICYTYMNMYYLLYLYEYVLHHYYNKESSSMFSLDQYKGCYWHVCRILR